MPVTPGPECVGEELSRFRRGELHSGKGGKVVTDPKQAKAIALSACGQSKYAETLMSMGYSEDIATEITAMFAEAFVKKSKNSTSVSSFEEPDWKRQFQDGKGPGPEKKDNYKTGIPHKPGVGQSPIAKTGVKGDLGKREVNDDAEMLSPVAYPKGPGNPQAGSSKEVFGMRALG